MTNKWKFMSGFVQGPLYIQSTGQITLLTSKTVNSLCWLSRKFKPFPNPSHPLNQTNQNNQWGLRAWRVSFLPYDVVKWREWNFSGGNKNLALSGREKSLVQTFCESCADFTHSFAHMTWKLVIQGCPTLPRMAQTLIKTLNHKNIGSSRSASTSWNFQFTWTCNDQKQLQEVVYCSLIFPKDHYGVSLFSVVDCGSLTDPVNGQVNTNGTTFGETAIYSCDTGYNLVGNNTRTCQATGQWSGNEPTCERMLLL